MSRKKSKNETPKTETEETTVPQPDNDDVTQSIGTPDDAPSFTDQAEQTAGDSEAGGDGQADDQSQTTAQAEGVPGGSRTVAGSDPALVDPDPAAVGPDHPDDWPHPHDAPGGIGADGPSVVSDGMLGGGYEPPRPQTDPHTGRVVEDAKPVGDETTLNNPEVNEGDVIVPPGSKQGSGDDSEGSGD